MGHEQATGKKSADAFGRRMPGLSPYAWLIAVCLARIAKTPSDVACLAYRRMPGLSPYAAVQVFFFSAPICDQALAQRVAQDRVG